MICYLLALLLLFFCHLRITNIHIRVPGHLLGQADEVFLQPLQPLLAPQVHVVPKEWPELLPVGAHFAGKAIALTL